MGSLPLQNTQNYRFQVLPPSYVLRVPPSRSENGGSWGLGKGGSTASTSYLWEYLNASISKQARKLQETPYLQLHGPCIFYARDKQRQQRYHWKDT